MSDSPASTVLIVGAGPVGLTMACELARYGIACRIIEQRTGPSKNSKALAIFPRTLEVFEIMGVMDRIEACGQRLGGISVSAGSEQLAEFVFDDLPSRYRHVVSLPQSETEKRLIEHLDGFKIAVQWETALAGLSQDGESVRATIRRSDGETEVIKVPWLIGCDGAHSTVRHALEIPFEGASNLQSFILADVTMEPPVDESRAHIFFSDDGVMAVFPFGRGRCRIVAQVEPSAVDSSEPPGIEEIRRFVRVRSPLTAEIRETHWTSRFRVSTRKIEKFRHERVFLCGDSAHIHSPAGGQGMNTGIQDSFNLAWKLAAVIRRKAAGNLLESYNAEREPVSRGVLRLTDTLTRMATTRSAFLLRARRLLVPVIAGIGPLRHRITERLAELSVAYRNSPIVSGRYGRFQSGDRMPDLEFFADDGSAVRLYELLARAKRLVLLVIAGSPSDDSTAGPIIPAAYGDFVASWIVGLPPNAHPGMAGLVSQNFLHPDSGLTKRGMLLIRPDAYIGFGSEDWDAGKLEEHLARLISG